MHTPQESLQLLGRLFLIVGGIGLAMAGDSGNQEPIRLAREACTSLQGLAIPASAIGLPTSGALVENAMFVAASETGNSNGDFCKVTGIVKPHHPGSPNLEFEVNLPQAWNRRALQMGGGGYDGSLVTGLTLYSNETPTSDPPLKQGYVTLGSDGGHQGKAGFDGSFGMDDEALLNFGKESVKKAHDAALFVIRKAYDQRPARFYFIGGSQGGHEALDAAARYPQDYDGVVAFYPAYNVTLLHLGSLNVGKALYADGGAGWIDPQKTKLIGDAVYAKCDALDGAKDGIISNVAGCNAAFDIAALRCPNGADTGDTCLSDAQIKTVRTINSSYKPGVTVAGMDTFPKWALLEGALFQGPSNFGQVRQPSNPLSGKEALLYTAGDQTVKFIITRDPHYDPMKFDPKQWQKRIAVSASIMDVTNVSLDRFRARGGKIIMLHGTADDFITPHNSIQYYQRQVAQFGQERLNSFLRFYEIPGFGHGFGRFNAKFDSLAALENWVEKGQAPSGLIVMDGNKGANRTRPLCEWPAWPKFTGASGTENSAASYMCATE
ncbi:MAG TPA: tannase/feruloyl esterase family alpha/beta hydrolase [Bryobacteraceae bacterium]|nr:tannase/feruloyl esterase family alpha/beta hydrolase [Bryobacteraceae bacterium]